MLVAVADPTHRSGPDKDDYPLLRWLTARRPATPLLLVVCLGFTPSACVPPSGGGGGDPDAPAFFEGAGGGPSIELQDSGRRLPPNLGGAPAGGQGNMSDPPDAADIDDASRPSPADARQPVEATDAGGNGRPPGSPGDRDGDAVRDPVDNCPDTFNPDQADDDGDGVGDACDDLVDGDGDGVANALDNCPTAHNGDQSDRDDDGLGDACDNCPSVPNPHQRDSDPGNGGDLCQPDRGATLIYLTWTEAAPSQDYDLHLLHPYGRYFQEVFDCHADFRATEWGARHGGDRRGGRIGGIEVIALDNNAPVGRYTIGVTGGQGLGSPRVTVICPNGRVHSLGPVDLEGHRGRAWSAAHLITGECRVDPLDGASPGAQIGRLQDGCEGETGCGCSGCEDGICYEAQCNDYRNCDLTSGLCSACDDVNCGPGEICDDGACRPRAPCEAVMCPPMTSCVERLDRCVRDCQLAGCPQGIPCIDGHGHGNFCASPCRDDSDCAGGCPPGGVCSCCLVGPNFFCMPTNWNFPHCG